MLVLTRKAGETMVIDRDDLNIKVVILNVNAGQVRIGVEAPKHISVHRKEVQDRIDKEEGR